MASDYPLPYADDAEASLLSCVIIDPNLFDEYNLDILPVEAFGYRNAIIWKHMLRLHHEDLPIDLVTLTEALRSAGDLTESVDVPYLLGLDRLPAVGTNAWAYALQVREAWDKRRLMNASLKCLQGGGNGATPEELQEALQAALRDVTHRSGFTLDEAAAQADKYLSGDARLSTGFRSIDRVTGGGIPIGDVTVLAGRTSIGKSALAHAIAFNVGSTLVLSPDQPLPEIIANQACRQCRIPLDVLRSSVLDEAGKDKWRDARTKVVERMRKDVNVDDGSLSMSRLIAEIRRAGTMGKKLVVVDHIQCVRPDKRSTDRLAFMQELTGAVKAAARDYGVAVMMLSQLSRSIDTRDDKRPLLSDLSERKTIEEDANLVLFVYRERYYDRSNPDDTAEIIVGKNKTGARGITACLRYNETFVEFREVGAL